MTDRRVSTPRTAGMLLLATLVGGAIAGSLDIIGASIQTWANGNQPTRMLQSIASGLLGAEAYEGGMATAFLGLVIHFGIATSMAAAFVLVASRLTALLRAPLYWGPLYGLAMYGLMSLIVLPLRWPETFPRFDPVGTTVQILFHMFLVGLPIAVVASRLLRYPRAR